MHHCVCPCESPLSTRNEGTFFSSLFSHNTIRYHIYMTHSVLLHPAGTYLLLKPRYKPFSLFSPFLPLFLRRTHVQEIARHKLFRPISSGNRSLQTFSAHFLRKSAVTKLFRLISSGNRAKKTFSAKSLRKSTATSEKEGIEDGPQENGIFFGLLRDIVEILFACYRNGSIFAAVSWHM